MRERREASQCLNLAQVVHLIEAVEVVLHALDRHVLGILDALCLQNFGERPLPFLRNQTVLCNPGMR